MGGVQDRARSQEQQPFERSMVNCVIEDDANILDAMVSQQPL